jgi:hypothetical protein
MTKIKIAAWVKGSLPSQKRLKANRELKRLLTLKAKYGKLP